MKKILIILSLVVVAMFLIGCSTGEGYRFRKTVQKAPTLNQEVKEVRSGTYAQSKCKYVDFPNLNNVWSGQTYEQICANQGAMSCTAVDVKHITYVYENSSCNPPTRWRNTNNILHPELCSDTYDKDLRHLFPGEEECTEGSFPPGYGPADSSEYFASRSDFVNLDGILCCT